MSIDPSSSSSFVTDVDDESWLVLVRQKLQAAGHDRFEELAHDAEAELKRKVAAVPAGDASQPQRDALFQEFMQEMRGIARMQEEEVDVLVEEEKRERAWTRSLSASLSGGSVDGRIGASGMSASSSTSTVPPSVDEALLEEQRRIWDALRSGPYSGAVDDSGSSTEEETEERRRFVSRTGRARSGTISPPRATDHEQRSKSATVSPAPVYKPELTPGHSIYPPSSLYPPQASSQGFFVPPSQSTQIPKGTRRRTQSTSSTRELEMSKHVITPPSSVSTANAFTSSQSQHSVSQQSQNQQTQQKHKVWIPPKPAHMVSNEISNTPNNATKDGKDAKDANSEANGTKKRPRPVSQLSTPALNLIMTTTPVSSNPTPSTNSATPTASTNKVSQRARSEDPTERKPEKLFGPVTTGNGKHPKAPENTSSTTSSSSSQHYGQHTSTSTSNINTNSNSSSRRSASTSASTTGETQAAISQPYAVWKPDMSSNPSRNDPPNSSLSGTTSSSQHTKHGNSQTSLANPNEPVPYPPIVAYGLTGTSSSSSKGSSGLSASRVEKNQTQIVEATGSISQSSSSGLSGSTSNSGGRSDDKSSHRAYKNQSARGQGSQSNPSVAPSSRSSSVSSRSNADADDAAATTDSMTSFWLQASGDHVEPTSSYQSQTTTSRHPHSHSHTTPSSSSPPQQRTHLPTVSEVFDQSTIRASNHGSSTRQSSSAVFAPSVGPSRSTSHSHSQSQNYSQSSSQDADDVVKAVVPYDMSIWVPSQPQQPPSKVLSTTTSSSSALTQRSSTSMTSQSSQSSVQSQDGFYAVADRARSDRHRIISAEYKTRAEVVAVFQKKVEDLMKDFVIALEKVDTMNAVGKFT